MSKVQDLAKRAVDAVEGVLLGEPARAIGYGAAAVIYVVAKAVGAIPDQTPQQSLGEATAAIAMLVTVVESIRHFVYSPATVFDILDEVANDEQGNG